MKSNYIFKINELIVFFFCVIFCITGCTQQIKNIQGSTYYLNLQTKQIKTEISRLENTLKKGDESLSEQTSLFYLALLYAHYKNPEPDYEYAVKNLEKYISLNPVKAKQKNHAQYRLNLLKKLVENKNFCNELKTFIATLKQENTTLKQENIMLMEKYEKLIIENKNIKAIIEELKQLDIQLEKKRKNS